MEVYDIPMDVHEDGSRRIQNRQQFSRMVEPGTSPNQSTRREVPLLVLAVINLIVVLVAAGIGIFVIVQAKNEIEKSAKDNMSSSMQKVLQELGPVKGNGGKIHTDLINLNRSINIINQKVSCQFFSNGKCFNVILPERTSSGAKRLCEDKTGKLANIYNKEHMKAMMSYIREWIPWTLGTIPYLDLYLGMTIEPKNGSIFLNDGSLLEEKLLWDDGFPDGISKDTFLVLRVNKDPSSTDQYLWDVPPFHSASALCEI